MAPVRFSYSFRKLIVIGVISFLVVALGLLSGCRTAPDEVEIDRPPFTAIRHIDVALTLVHDLPAPVIVDVYVDAARNLAAAESGMDSMPRSEDLARRVDAYMRRIPDPSGEIILRWARMWNDLAALDTLFASRADAVSRDAAARLGSAPDERVSGRLLVDLLDAQLRNENAMEESIRRNLDELYLLEDDEARASALVGAADLIRAEGGRTALNPVVQQAIAIMPAVESPTQAMILNARLSELSEALGNTRDVRMLQDQAIRRAEAGLLVSPADQPAIRQVLTIFVRRGDRPGAEVIVENITPVSSRAIAYAALGTAAARHDRRLPFEAYHEEALSIAFSIDDPETRAVTAAEVILLRVEGQSDWAPTSAIADLLGRVTVPRFSQDARVRTLSALYAALILADRADETARMRGLIRSVDELVRINTMVGEMMVRRERPEEARSQIMQIERVPPATGAAGGSPAFRIARLWITLEEYDRAISVLLDAEPAERARILVLIPADHTPNPAAVTDLERLLGVPGS